MLTLAACLVINAPTELQVKQPHSQPNDMRYNWDRVPLTQDLVDRVLIDAAKRSSPPEWFRTWLLHKLNLPHLVTQIFNDVGKTPPISNELTGEFVNCLPPWFGPTTRRQIVACCYLHKKYNFNRRSPVDALSEPLNALAERVQKVEAEAADYSRRHMRLVPFLQELAEPEIAGFADRAEQDQQQRGIGPRNRQQGIGPRNRQQCGATFQQIKQCFNDQVGCQVEELIARFQNPQAILNDLQRYNTTNQPRIVKNQLTVIRMIIDYYLELRYLTNDDLARCSLYRDDLVRPLKIRLRDLVVPNRIRDTAQFYTLSVPGVMLPITPHEVHALPITGDTDDPECEYWLDVRWAKFVELRKRHPGALTPTQIKKYPGSYQLWCILVIIDQLLQGIPADAHNT
jgi:hypothetical protein